MEGGKTRGREGWGSEGRREGGKERETEGLIALLPGPAVPRR